MATAASRQFHIHVLISGNGTNLQALIDATTTTSQSSTPSLPNTYITRVISNRKDAYGLTRATIAGIPTTYHNLVSYKRKHPPTEQGIQSAREEYDAALADVIIYSNPKPDLVVCAGWMHIFSPGFITILTASNIRIINLHPALPGQFSGGDAIHRAWEAFQRGEISGAGVMVHYVIGEVDMGPPIVVRDVELRVGEPEFEFAGRVHEAEWGIIVEGTRVALEKIREEEEGRRKGEEGAG